MSALRILVVHATSTRRTSGDRVRVQEVQESLSSAGFQVFDTSIPLSLDRYTFLRPDSLRNIIGNVFPLRILTHLKVSFSYQGVLDYMLFGASQNFLRKTVRRVMPDVLLAEGSRVGGVSSIVSREFSISCIIDMHGLAFAEARGYKQRNWQQILNMETEAFKNCDYLVVVSRKMKDYVTGKMGISNAKVILAPNGSEPQQLVAHYSTPLKVIYAGGFSYWESVNDFLNIAKYANPKIFKFYIAGIGPLGKELFGRIKNENIPVTYLGYIPRFKIFETLSKMQIGIAPSTKDLARQVASPIKIFDYMAAGLPVITPKIGDWGDLVDIEDCGIALEHDDTENYVKALNTMAHENIWTTKSRNAVECIREKYAWNKVLEPITSLLLTHER